MDFLSEESIERRKQLRAMRRERVAVTRKAVDEGYKKAQEEAGPWTWDEVFTMWMFVALVAVALTGFLCAAHKVSGLFPFGTFVACLAVTGVLWRGRK